MCGAFSFLRSKQIASGGSARVASEPVIRLHESVPRTPRDLNGASFGEPWQVEGGNRRNGYTWKVGVTYLDGKRSVLSRKAATSEEALEAIRSAVRGRKPRGRRSTTMSELADLWEAAQRNAKTAVVSEQTRLQYVSTWKRHLDPHFGARTLDSVTHEEIFAFIHDDERTIRPKSLVDVMRALFRHAVNRGLTSSNPAQGGFEIATPEPTPRPIAPETMLVIERHLASLQSRGRRTDPLILLHTWQTMRGAAARIGEVLGLQVRDWDSSTRRLRIGETHIGKVESTSRPGGTTYGAISGAKTPAGRRTVTVASDVARVLDARCDGQPPTAWVFRTAAGRFLSPENVRTRLRRELAKLGLKDTVTPHDLRDTAASVLAQELTRIYGLADGLRAAAAQLGHAGVGRALKAYVDPSSTVEDHSAILARTNPLEKVAREARSRLLTMTITSRVEIGSITPADGFVHVVVDTESVELVRAELVEYGDLVTVSADPRLVYSGDEEF